MKQQSITSLPLAPDVERHRRAVKYTIAMSVRVLCLISLLFVHGWWLLIPAAGAIFLPYFAVVIANVSSGRQGEVERPGNIVPVRPGPDYPGAGASEPAEERTPRDDDAGRGDDAQPGEDAAGVHDETRVHDENRVRDEKEQHE